MMHVMTSCPSDETLRILADERTNPPLYADLEHHVENCPACQNRLESLAWECRTPAADPLPRLPTAGNAPEIPGFEIKEELGRGSMGVVYLARDLRVGRSVALKVVPAGPGTDRRPRNRWRKEGKAFSRVRHPNVVVLHDIGEVGSWFYLVLEYIPGRALKDRLDGPLPRREAAQLLARVADAVHCIHQAGVLHLDLKPANILLDGAPDSPLDRATPKVADFGVAHLLVNAERGEETSQLAHGSWGGTPSYMAPEQISGTRDQLCPATDVHALGVILYKLLTGRPPFQGTSSLETLDQVRGQNPVPLRRLNPKIPRDLETIALKCLEKHPARRYASAEGLAGDLRRWLEDKPISARPVSPIEHGWRWCRRHPAVASLAATLLMTLSVGFLAIVLLWRYAEAKRNHAEQQSSRAEQQSSRADAERLLAEADFKTAHAALVEVLELGRRSLATKDLSRDDLIACLQAGEAASSNWPGGGRMIPRPGGSWPLLTSSSAETLTSKANSSIPVRFTSNPCLAGNRSYVRPPMMHLLSITDWKAIRLARIVEAQEDAEEGRMALGEGRRLGRDPVTHRVRHRVGRVGGMPFFPREACRSPGRPRPCQGDPQSESPHACQLRRPRPSLPLSMSWSSGPARSSHRILKGSRPENSRVSRPRIGAA